MSDQGNVTLELLGQILSEIQIEQRKQKLDLIDIRNLVLSQTDYSRRLERRFNEMRDDLEIMFKSEMMGRMGNFEMNFEQKIDYLDLRMKAVEGKS